MTDSSTMGIQHCPGCGSNAVTKRGMDLNGNRVVWDDCLNCSWSSKMTTDYTAENPHDDYTQGQIDMLKALLRETKTTKTSGDIIFAAYNSREFPKAVVDEAREVLEGSNG